MWSWAAPGQPLTHAFRDTGAEGVGIEQGGEPGTELAEHLRAVGFRIVLLSGRPNKSTKTSWSGI